MTLCGTPVPGVAHGWARGTGQRRMWGTAPSAGGDAVRLRPQEPDALPWMKDTNRKSRILKLRKENRGKYFYDIGVGMDYLTYKIAK